MFNFEIAIPCEPCQTPRHASAFGYLRRIVTWAKGVYSPLRTNGLAHLTYLNAPVIAIPMSEQCAFIWVDSNKPSGKSQK